MSKVDPYQTDDWSQAVAHFTKMREEHHAKVRAAEVVLSPIDITKHKVGYRATQVSYSVPCFTGYKIAVGQRFAMLQPISEFNIDPGPTALPEERFYPGTVIEVIGDKDPMMKFEFDGGPGGCKWIMCGVKEYLRYCIPIPEKTAADIFQKIARKVCSKYTRPKGVMGGPCLKCGASQPEHVKKRKKKNVE